MILQPAEVAQAARVYFSTFVELQPGVWGRPDPQDMGAEYRALIGVPGGLDGPYGAALRAANLHNMTLVADTKGHQPDTIGTNRVYVMDSHQFPAVQVRSRLIVTHVRPISCSERRPLSPLTDLMAAFRPRSASSATTTRSPRTRLSTTSLTDRSFATVGCVRRAVRAITCANGRS